MAYVSRAFLHIVFTIHAFLCQLKQSSSSCWGSLLGSCFVMGCCSCYGVATCLLCFCYVFFIFFYVLLCFDMFCYFLLFFTMFFYVLLCFAMFSLCFAMFCHFLLCFAMFWYVLLCFAMFLQCSWFGQSVPHPGAVPHLITLPLVAGPRL